MTTTEREQLGWSAPESVVAEFESSVVDRYGALRPFRNEAVEIALREFLDTDRYATVESRIRRVATAVGQEPPNRDRTHIPEHVREEDRTKMWISIRSNLKQEVATFAEERNLDNWEVLTAALREYIDGGRAARLQNILSPEVVDELESQVSGGHQTAADNPTTDDTRVEQSERSAPERGDERTLGETNIGISTGDVGGTTLGEPTLVTNGDTVDTPVTPVYLESRMDEQLEATIAKLPGGTEGLPRPFSRSELYRAAAESGIPVWNETTKDQVTDRICTRLDYEWNPDVGKFVPIIDPIVEGVISDATPTLKSSLQDLPADLQTDVERWRAMHGLDRLEDPTETLARQALFRYLLRAAVYEKYHRQGDLPELSGDIRQRFRQAREQTDNPVFETCVLDKLVWQAEEPFTDVLEARHRLAVARQPAEVIGRLLSTLTPHDSRKQLGQFRTRPVLGDVMRRWVSDGRDSDRILDPGIGAAALSSPSYRYWSLSTDPESVEGIDRSPLGVSLAATALTLHNQSHTLHTDDFLTRSPDDIEGFDGVVLNPPYTKHHDLPEEYRDDVIEPIKQDIDYNISGNVPLYVYFYFHLKKFLSPGDRIALITPYFLDTKHGAPVTEDMLTTFDVEAFVKFDLDEPVFAGADTTGLITLLEVPSGEQPDSATQFIRVTDLPGQHTLLNAIAGTHDDNPDWGFVTSVQQPDLDSTQNLSIRFNPLDIDIDLTQLPSLSELTTTSTMLATGWNDAFCLSQSEVDKFGIEENHLVPLIRSTASLRTDSETPRFDYRREDWDRQRESGNEVYLLSPQDITPTPKITPDSATSTLTAYQTSTGTDGGSESGVKAYLAHWATKLAEEPDQHQGVRNRDRWYELSLRSLPRIVVPTLSRNKFQFVVNEMGAHALNNMLGVDPNPELDETEVKALLAYLNSGLAEDILDCYSRDHPGGANKLEKGYLKKVRTIDPRQLPEDIVADLATAFDRLRKVARADDSTDAIIDEIDSLLRKALRYHTTEDT